MKNLFLVFSLLFCGGMAFAQNFQRTIYDSDKNFNHYSIESMSDGYVCVGTLFENQERDIHVVKLSLTGEVQWERVIDKTQDDRALDVLVDDNDNIVLTGYTINASTGLANLYVARLDPNGDYTFDYTLSYTQIGSFGSNFSTIGTNIIESNRPGRYIIGGLSGRNIFTQPERNDALIIEIDQSAGLMAYNRIGVGFKNQTITDIQTVPDGYFITGSVHRGASFGINRGVMAAIVDENLDLVKNFSFDDKMNAPLSIGSSVVYDENEDAVYVLSNNSDYHNPQITKLTGISDPQVLCDLTRTKESYLLLLDERGESIPAAYKLEICAWNSNHLIASGYFKFREDNSASNGGGTKAWIIEFDKNTGQRVAGMEWNANPASDFVNQNDFLTDFAPNSPEFFTPEIMVPRKDKEGYVLVTPQEIDQQFALGITTTSYMQTKGCFSDLRFESKKVDIHWGCLDEGSSTIFSESPKYYPQETEHENGVVCANKSAISENLSGANGEMSHTNLSVYPNPSRKHVDVLLPNGFEVGQLEILDLTGKRMMRIEVASGKVGLDISKLEHGIYTIRFSVNSGEIFQSKFVKSN